MEKLQVEIAHTLARDQLDEIYQQVYQTTTEAIQDARRDTEIDNDLLYSKASLRRFLNNCSADYVEELLADETFPRGRMLSERKTVFSKKAIRVWLLKNEK